MTRDRGRPLSAVLAGLRLWVRVFVVSLALGIAGLVVWFGVVGAWMFWMLAQSHLTAQELKNSD